MSPSSISLLLFNSHIYIYLVSSRSGGLSPPPSLPPRSTNKRGAKTCVCDPPCQRHIFTGSPIWQDTVPNWVHAGAQLPVGRLHDANRTLSASASVSLSTTVKIDFINPNPAERESEVAPAPTPNNQNDTKYETYCDENFNSAETSTGDKAASSNGRPSRVPVVTN